MSASHQSMSAIKICTVIMIEFSTVSLTGLNSNANVSSHSEDNWKWVDCKGQSESRALVVSLMLNPACVSPSDGVELKPKLTNKVCPEVNKTLPHWQSASHKGLIVREPHSKLCSEDQDFFDKKLRPWIRVSRALSIEVQELNQACPEATEASLLQSASSRRLSVTPDWVYPWSWRSALKKFRPWTDYSQLKTRQQPWEMKLKPQTSNINTEQIIEPHTIL